MSAVVQVVNPDAVTKVAPTEKLDRPTKTAHVQTSAAAGATDSGPQTTTGEAASYRWRPAAQRMSPAARWGYGLLSAVALGGLVGQATYFYRDELASRVPAAAPALMMACAQLGCRLEPPQRTDALGFVGADLAADPAHKGLLVFTATLRNSGAQAVAYPHLILSLDGLSGELVARKVFAPADFAPATANLGRGLDGGAEIEVKLYLDASQSTVVGFKVDHAYL